MARANPLRILRLTALVALSMGVVGADCGTGADSACPATGPCPPDDAPGAEIRGVVVDSEENPVASATVETVPPTSMVQTQSDGRFSIEVPPPVEAYTITVVAHHQNLGTIRAEVAVTVEDPNPEVRLVLEPTEDASDVPPVTGIRTTVPESVFPCLFEGEPVDFAVEVRNASDASVEGVTVHDTLSPPAGFSRPLEVSDIVVDRERFPDARVTIHPDGFSFEVALGPIAPTAEASEDGYVTAYRVSLPAGATRGTFCNRIVARAEDGSVWDEDTGCVTTTLALMLDVDHDDGALGPDGTFDETVDVFHVGDGSEESPDALAYRIEIANDNCVTLEDSRVVAVLDPTGVVAYREPVQGYPTAGTVTERSDGRFVWEIGDLAHGESAILVIRAEAVAEGSTVSRVEFSTSALTAEKIDEEPTLVEP